ncbi:MAG: DUF4173 domain-containing protein [Bacteroidetes bacterium]|nr:MAG: DUF4173 domain-containing protein [Bacteroidota bacterium]
MKSFYPLQKGIVSILFILLFHYLWKWELTGINLILTEILLLAYAWYRNGFRKSFSNYINIAAFLFSSIGFLIHGSAWSIFINVLSCLLLFAQSFSISENLIEPFTYALLRMIPFIKEEKKGSLVRKSGNRFRWTYIAIPLFLIFAFGALYANAIPGFSDFFADFFRLFPRLDFYSLLLLFLGYIITLYAWRGTTFKITLLSEWALTEEQTRTRFTQVKGLTRRLLNEYFIHRITLVSLVALITMAVFFDIVDLSKQEWKYQTYESVQNGVHSGTTALVIAIMASIFLAAYVFRGNLQFYPKDSSLKKLTYAWLGLNGLLSITLAYRSWGYIQMFNLAYKRIAILVFILCALYGLYTVFLKIAKTKSLSFILRQNMNMVLACCALTALPNWDRIIVNYNLNHSEAYQDYDYLFTRDLEVLLDHRELPVLKTVVLGNSPNYRMAYHAYGDITVYDYLQKRMLFERDELKKVTWKSMYLSRYRLKQFLDQLEIQEEVVD